MTGRTSGRNCPRCGEELVDADRRCGFCFHQRRDEAIATLVHAAKSYDTAANLARAEAVSTLRNLGYPTDQITKARALALDGYPVEQVLEILVGEGSEAVAA